MACHSQNMFQTIYFLWMSLSMLTETYFEETFWLNRLKATSFLEFGTIKAPEGDIDEPK